MNRRPELDGIRGAAILMVMAYHYLSAPLSEATAGLPLIISRSLSLFWSGVDFFFVLSGFLIGGILLDQRKSANYFQVFYIRRACRILPPYLMLLAAFVLVARMHPSTDAAFDTSSVPLWSYFLFLQNVLMSVNHSFGADWLAVTWSLAIEEQFYLVLPLLVRWLPDRRLAYVAVATLLGALLLRMCFSKDFLVYVSSPTRADSLFAGLLIALMMRSESWRARLKQHSGLLVCCLALGAVGMALLTRNRALIGEALYSWTTLFYSTVLLLATLSRPRWLFWLLTRSWLVYAGCISYGLYLFHGPVLWGVEQWLPNAGHAVPALGTVLLRGALATALCTALAAVSHALIEKHIVAFGHRWKYQPPA